MAVRGFAPPQVVFGLSFAGSNPLRYSTQSADYTGTGTILGSSSSASRTAQKRTFLSRVI